MKEYAAGLQQVYMRYEYSWWRVCGRSAADSSSYWKSMRQVCGKSAADLLQTLHHTERVCGKSAASLRQTCRRLFIILKEYAAGLQQVCGRPAADSSSYWKSMRQVCGRVCGKTLYAYWKRWLSAAGLLQICGKSAAGVCGRLISSYWKSMRQVCGKSAAKLICMWKRWLSAAGLLQICGKSAAGVCGRLISFLWVGVMLKFTCGLKLWWTTCKWWPVYGIKLLWILTFSSGPVTTFAKVYTTSLSLISLFHGLQSEHDTDKGHCRTNCEIHGDEILETCSWKLCNHYSFMHSMIHRWKYSLKRGNKGYLCQHLHRCRGRLFLNVQSGTSSDVLKI